jgi:uncharacterized membrane protein
MGVMTSMTMRILTAGTALGAGAMGGVFLGFSTFVMSGLSRLSSSQGIAAMQSINVTAVRPPLMTGFLGTAAACVPVMVVAVRSWGDRRAALLLAGGTLYLVGVIGLTVAYHVPRNDALAALDPGSAGAAEYWSTYLRGWTRANHVRAGSGLLAAAALVAALLDDPR